MKRPLIGFDNCFICANNDILYRYPLSDLYSSTLCFLCQPVIELIAANDAQGVPLGEADVQSFGIEIKVDILRIHVRNLIYVEAETFEQNLRVEDEPSGAKFEAWVTRFFEDQDAGGEMRGSLL